MSSLEALPVLARIESWARVVDGRRMCGTFVGEHLAAITLDENAPGVAFWTLGERALPPRPITVHA